MRLFKRNKPVTTSVIPTQRRMVNGKMTEVVRMADVLDYAGNLYAMQNVARGMGATGLRNELSGAGGLADKSHWFTYIPHWINDYRVIESITTQSWLAERFINMPIDDMFCKPRVYSDDAFKAQEHSINLTPNLASAMKLGRKFGSGFLWMVTKEGRPDTPLDINNIMQGDLVNCIPIDRSNATVVSFTKDMMSPNFGKPEVYNFYIHGFGSVDIHHTRLYRFDGLSADSINGWKMYLREWGITALTPVMQEVFNDASVVSAITHLVQEASIPVQKVDGLKDIISRGAQPDEPSVDQLMESVSLYKSIYRMLFIDGDDSFDRTSVNFTHIPDIMLRFEERFAMASGISVTRFLGKSASGLNATGEGDQRNDSKTARIRQFHTLVPFYKWADPIIAKSAGTEVPTYTFPPLFEMSEEELANVDLSRSRSAKLMVDIGSWSPQEAKDYIATGEAPVGDLSPDAERVMSSAGNDPIGEANRNVVSEGVAFDK